MLTLKIIHNQHHSTPIQASTILHHAHPISRFFTLLLLLLITYVFSVAFVQFSRDTPLERDTFGSMGASVVGKSLLMGVICIICPCFLKTSFFVFVCGALESQKKKLPWETWIADSLMAKRRLAMGQIHWSVLTGMAVTTLILKCILTDQEDLIRTVTQDWAFAFPELVGGQVTNLARFAMARSVYSWFIFSYVDIMYQWWLNYPDWCSLSINRMYIHAVAHSPVNSADWWHHLAGVVQENWLMGDLAIEV